MSWQIPVPVTLPSWLPPFIQTVLHKQNASPVGTGEFLGQILWRRGWHDPELLRGFLDYQAYQPTSPHALGPDVERSIRRIAQSIHQGERVAIWGDFDADGVTATALLWEGLGQWLPQGDRLSYHIPDRLTDSHGLNRAGLATLAQDGVTLVITCDTGSTNGPELHYAQGLGLEVIVTDHHTLPPSSLPAFALINPRTLPPEHPLADLSGVAVAYKLMEALYDGAESLGLPPASQPLEYLLDLVTIGLIADLVNLRGDCRYLVQRGTQQFVSLDRNNLGSTPSRRPGVTFLLEACKAKGDRVTDISFGLGPRINAVSRIQGDASLAVELLTSRDPKRCKPLVAQVELLNTRRKGLQKWVLNQAETQLQQTQEALPSVIVLGDVGWPLGLLGLVAGQLMQRYQRPVVLLSLEADPRVNPQAQARGSGRSLPPYNLYDLLASQTHLLESFGGHPYAAGLRLEARYLPLLREGLQQAFSGQTLGEPLVFGPLASEMTIDLAVTLADLNMSFYRELKLLEPCGMGNPTPKLLIQGVEFRGLNCRTIQDDRGQPVAYSCTRFSLAYPGDDRAVPGLLWGSDHPELQRGRWDVVVEPSFNNKTQTYELRLLAWQPAHVVSTPMPPIPNPPLLDWRCSFRSAMPASPTPPYPPEDEDSSPMLLRTCPRQWSDLLHLLTQAQAQGKVLALAYDTVAPQDTPQAVGQRWLNWVKNLIEIDQPQELALIQRDLNVGDRTLDIGIWAVAALGIQRVLTPVDQIHLRSFSTTLTPTPEAQQRFTYFIDAIEEDQFQQRYFQNLDLNLVTPLVQPSSTPFKPI